MRIIKILYWILLGLFVVLFWEVLMNVLTVVLVVIAFYLLIVIGKLLKRLKHLKDID